MSNLLTYRLSKYDNCYAGNAENFYKCGLLCDCFAKYGFNPFTLKSDKFKFSPAASPEILHNTVR